MKLVGEVNIGSIEKIKSGKVREMFAFDDRMLIVTTDRISAFDYILPSLIPFKGTVLNSISNFWFGKLDTVIKNHLIETDIERFPEEFKKYYDVLRGRSVIVRKAKIFPIECVVRGYIAGSGWEEYKKSGSIGDIKLPEGLKMCDRLPEPVFTPTTKAEVGHDELITLNRAKNVFGSDIVDFLKNKSIELFEKASDYAFARGIIIADTKFEFGAFDDTIILVDEVLTPDSSRFWPLDDYEPGRQQKSYDKQFVRDYLLGTDWDRNSTPPSLPDEIIQKTSQRYIEAYETIVGESFTK